MKVKIGKKTVTLKVLRWGDFIKLEDEYGVDISKIAEGFSAKDLSAVLTIALQKADDTFMSADLLDLELTSDVFQPKVIQFLFGSQDVKGKNKTKNA